MSWVNTRSWINTRCRISAGLRATVLPVGLTCLIGLACLTMSGGHQASAAPDEGNASNTAIRDELQSIITRQLAAFGREDATEAESFASPQLRDRFPDPNGFLAMVKENYAALMKPRSTHFDEISDSPHGPLQRVTVVANDGTVWTAVYSFERVGTDWRISGCGLMKQESQDI